MDNNMTQSAMVPVFSTQAGSCLTTANWQEAGVELASFYLASLLMKPGYDFLCTLPDLAAYVAWHGSLVLNASLPTLSGDGFYKLCSHYDGRRISHSAAEILALIEKLQPDMVILPQGVLQNTEQVLSETIFPYIPVVDLPARSEIERPHGVYFSYDEKKSSSSELLQQLALQDRPCYIAGDLSLPLMLQLVNSGAQFVESDKPASDACHGTVYCSEGEISLLNNLFSMQLDPIDENCHCSTCSQQFTRAYLHHLLEHTPLLCQRLLIQHNIHYCYAALRSSR